MKKKLISVLAVCAAAFSVTSCGSTGISEDTSVAENDTAAVTSAPEEAEATAETTEEELVEPDYPVFTPDVNAITFNDSDDLFTAHCMAQKNFENDESNCKLSVAEYKGERQLKIEILDYDNEKYMYKTPKIVFDMDELVGAENLSKVKSFTCDITQVAVGEFKGDDGEMMLVPGNLMGTFGSNVGEESEWYQPAGSANEYATAEWNFEWEHINVEGKWLLKGFADGNTESTLVFMRWSIPNQADVYIDNITFYDEDGNSIPIAYKPGEASEDAEEAETEAAETEEETAAEEQ
ncbi:MAG: hypothetical protein MJ095_04075 [Oscillospiraceae bacterium]|nr:hypothetical protein [Oscillospiraceae bacterium]